MLLTGRLRILCWPGLRVKNLAYNSTGSVLILSHGYYQLALCSVMDSVDKAGMTEVVRSGMTHMVE